MTLTGCLFVNVNCWHICAFYLRVTGVGVGGGGGVEEGLIKHFWTHVRIHSGKV